MSPESMGRDLPRPGKLSPVREGTGRPAQQRVDQGQNLAASRLSKSEVIFKEKPDSYLGNRF